MGKTIDKKLSELKYSNPQIIALLLDAFHPISLRKGSIIAMHGLQNPLIYIEEGILKYYTIKIGEIVTHAVFNQGFILPNSGFLNECKDEEFIEVISDVKGWSLKFDELREVTSKHPDVYRLLLEIYDEILGVLRLHCSILAISDRLLRYSEYMKHYKELANSLVISELSSILRIEKKYLYIIKKRYNILD